MVERRHEVREEAARQVAGELLSDRADHRLSGLGGSLGQALLGSIGITVLDNEVQAGLELLHEGDSVTGERIGDGGESVVELASQVRADRGQVRVGTGLESRGSEVLNRLEQRTGHCEIREGSA